MENTTENLEPQMEAQPTQSEKDVPKVTLLSAISYTNKEDYLTFLEQMTGEHAVVALIAAANHAQARGAYNLDEAELIAKAIRKLTVKPATAEAQPEVSPEQAAPTATAKAATKKPARAKK